MMRSMFAGVSGLKTHQTRMDIIGNNIANVNTAGYKSSRATFQEMLSQTIRAASAPTETRGGTNPHQVGLGVSLGSIDVKHTQGNTQSTGYVTDLAIEGDGFFVLGHGANRQYTRAGVFGLDNGTEGNFVSLINGERVLGYKADRDGIIDPHSSLEPLYISAADTISPRATTEVIFAGNLDNRFETGADVRRSVQVFDSGGREQTIFVDFTKQEDGNNWLWDAHRLTVDGETDSLTDDIAADNRIIEFDNYGSYLSVDENTVEFEPANAEGLEVVLDFSAFTQYADAFTGKFMYQNGYASGALESYAIDQSGTIVGSFSNGLTRALGQVALARFTNPAGLQRAGSTMFVDTANSGTAQIGAPGTSGYGVISPSSLEMSNVDLSDEFTDMIVTQRGFQANSRIITSSDEMLQELVNLKR